MFASPPVNALPLPPSISPALFSAATGPAMLPKIVPVARLVIVSNADQDVVNPLVVVATSPRSATPPDPVIVPALSTVASSWP